MFTKSTHQQMVELFMKKAGQEVPQKPMLPDEKTRWLRAVLILEEALETVKALGFNPVSTEKQATKTFKFKTGASIGFDQTEPDLVEIIDGCADIKVVTTGTLSACGVPDERFQQEVDESNLRKFGPGGRRREDGKWLKPPDWQPPQIQKLIDQSQKD